jgi:hypothetical protein
MQKTVEYIQAQFYRGRFKEIIDQCVDGAEVPITSKNLACVVGALAFVGRIEDAISLSRDKSCDLESDNFALRFYIGIGLVRQSRYDEGSKMLRESYKRFTRLSRARTFSEPADTSSQIQTAGFYVHQGLAFLRFFESRLFKARLHADRAWTYCLTVNFGFGQALAADLLGHVLVLSGKITRGMESLNRAAAIAFKLDNEALGFNIKSSLAYYRSRHGLDGVGEISDLAQPQDHTLSNLKNLIKNYAPQDNFSLAAAQVELSRQFVIRGDWDASEILLQKASPIILAAKHSRHTARLHHRFAYNRYLFGDFSAALEYLDRAEKFVDHRFDLVERLSIQGLRLQILQEMVVNREAGLGDMDSKISQLQSEIKDLTAKTGLGIGRNILWRQGHSFTPTVQGDDPFGDLKSLTSTRGGAGYNGILRIIAAGLYGFLNEYLRFGNGARVICLDLIPAESLVFDRGNVQRSRERFSQIMKSILIAVSKNAVTKTQLIETYWGFSYHPTRHDPMLYAVINRIRRALGSRGKWLLVDGQSYRLETGVRVFVYEHQIINQAPRGLNMDSAAKELTSSQSETSDLNYRQLAILDALQRERYITAQWCVEKFEISRITAGRDLGQLCSLGLLVRHGRARVTSYSKA